jgi:hypothetical protein
MPSTNDISTMNTKAINVQETNHVETEAKTENRKGEKLQEF